MAEGFARTLLDRRKFSILSAGLEAHGLNERAVSVMAEAGIDISGQRSTLLTREMLDTSDVIVTLCGHAEQNCPLVPAQKVKLHWPLQDPAKLSGSEAEIVTAFKKIRDEIRSLVMKLPEKIDHLPY